MSFKLTCEIADVTGLQTALDNKQDKGTTGSTYVLPAATATTLGGIKVGAGLNITNGVLSTSSISGGGTTEGQLINLPDQTWWKTLQPANYGTTYSNGSRQGKYFIGGYKINPGINFSTTDRPDNVFTLAAYNTLLPNGSREFANEAAWDITVETHYDNSGFLPYGDFEAHLFRSNSTDGGEHRHHSIYVNKTTGGARQDFEANQFTFMYTRKGQNPFTYAILQEASLELTAAVAGRKVGFSATNYDGVVTGLWNIGGEGYIYVPGLINGRANLGLSITAPFYADNVSAKTALGVGKVYKTKVNGVRVFAETE